MRRRLAAMDAEEMDASRATGASAGAALFPRVAIARRRTEEDEDGFFEQGNLERALLAGKSFSLAEGGGGGDDALLLAGDVDDEEESFCMTHVCSVCGRRLPTAHLLDIHINEAHSSYFQAMAARGMKVYECLLEDCGKKFRRCASRPQRAVHRADGGAR